MQTAYSYQSPPWPGSGRVLAVTPRGAIYDWVNIGISPKRDPGGSPFQMPARLADGLGLESDLGHGYPWPCAPSPVVRSHACAWPSTPGNLVPPRWLAGRQANLGCSNTSKLFAHP